MDNIFRILRLINVIYLQTLLLYFLYCTLWDNKKKLDQKLKVSWVVSGARRRNIFLFETVKKEGNIKNQEISPWRKEPLKQIYNQTIPVTQCSSETLFRLWYFCGIFVFHFTIRIPTNVEHNSWSQWTFYKSENKTLKQKVWVTERTQYTLNVVQIQW
jgi:hypothetical protein